MKKLVQKYGATICLYALIALIAVWAINWANTPYHLSGVVTRITPVGESGRIWEVELLDIEAGLTRATMSPANEEWLRQLTLAHEEVQSCQLSVTGVTVRQHGFYPTIKDVMCHSDTQTSIASP